jgi:dihydrofolate reductase
MKVKLIVAKGANNEIGKDNDLIWHLPADMRFFTETTKGHIVLMGRKNWDSIPLKYRPLSNRTNVVVTHNEAFDHPDCTVFQSIESAIAFYKNNPAFDGQDLFIIGGGQIYNYCLEHNLLDEMYITYIDETFDADTFFPNFNADQWQKKRIMEHAIDAKNPHAFEVYHFTQPIKDQ